MKTPDNPPAFPRPDFHSATHFTAPAQDGMTLRDYFAGQALMGELSAQSREIGEWDTKLARVLAERCGVFADAMLAERSREKGTPNEPKP